LMAPRTPSDAILCPTQWVQNRLAPSSVPQCTRAAALCQAVPCLHPEVCGGGERIALYRGGSCGWGDRLPPVVDLCLEGFEHGIHIAAVFEMPPVPPGRGGGVCGALASSALFGLTFSRPPI